MGITRKAFALGLGILLSGHLSFGQSEESAKILTQTGPGMINLIVYGKDKQEIAKGTAFAITKDIAVTSYHLISQAVSCVGFNIKKKEVDIEGVAAVDKNLDLALVKFDGKVQPLVLGNSDELAAGKKVLAVGVNESGEIVVSEGAVRSLFDLGGGQKIADSSLAIPDSFSGGAVLGESGKILGVIQVLDKRLRFIAPANAVAGLSKTVKVTPFKSWQPEDYVGTLEASWLAGRLYAWMGEPYSAQRGLEKVAKAQPNNLEAWSLLAKVYDGQRDYQSAIPAYQKVVELDPQRGDAYFGLGQIFVRMQRSSEAIAALEKAIQLDPNNKEAVLNLGEAYDTAREFQKAGDAYQKYIGLKPENVWTAYQRLGMSRLNANEFDAAATALEEARQAQPQDQTINYNLAQAYDKAQKLDKAEEVYKNLAQISPKDAVTWYSMILTMYAKANLPAKAVEAAKKIVELKPNDEQVLYNLAQMYQQDQKYEEAIDTYKKAVAVKPTYDIAHFQIGSCLYNLKRYKEAMESFKKNVEIVPEHFYGWLFLGMCHMQVKDFNGALDPIKKAVDLQPENGTGLYNLAIIYLNLKDNYSAREIYKKLQAVDPNMAAKLKQYIK